MFSFGSLARSGDSFPVIPLAPVFGALSQAAKPQRKKEGMRGFIASCIEAPVQEANVSFLTGPALVIATGLVIKGAG
jgi:hypothetical protein